REDELGPVLLLATADIGLGRQHADEIIGQSVAAIVGFATPDRKHHGWWHAEAGFDRGQRRTVLRQQPLPIPRETRDARLLQIVRRHLDEFGLRRRAGGW